MAPALFSPRSPTDLWSWIALGQRAQSAHHWLLGPQAAARRTCAQNAIATMRRMRATARQRRARPTPIAAPTFAVELSPAPRLPEPGLPERRETRSVAGPELAARARFAAPGKPASVRALAPAPPTLLPRCWPGTRPRGNPSPAPGGRSPVAFLPPAKFVPQRR